MSSRSMVCENLPPATLSRIAKQLRDLSRETPDGVHVVESQNLSELVVSYR